VNDVITIDTGSRSADVVVPEGVNVVIGSDSGRIQVRGQLGDVAIVSASGRVELAHARSVDVRTQSGRIEIDTVDEECRAHSMSARVEVGHCGRADISSNSGRVDVAETDGPATVHSVSGRITIGVSRAADVEAETVSGRIEVAFPPGVRVHQALANKPDEARPVGTDCTVVARSGSGRVTVSAQ
jgi:DUF4097 and DUF4098 domain-containing protein YvlB